MANMVTSSPANEAFLEANKDSLIVLLFDADFTDQSDIVSAAEKALLEATELKGKIVVGKAMVEQSNDLAIKFGVEAVPIVVCVYKGVAVKRINTLDSSKLVSIVQEVLKQHTPMQLEGGETQPQDNVDPKQKFKDYLKQLVNRAPIMIFMKGEPKQPRCGFSKQLVELLAKYDEIKYDTFDILLDEDVRQGLKELSDWPTYPQIYVKGEFVGGLDILKQLHETGELESTLKA